MNCSCSTPSRATTALALRTVLGLSLLLVGLNHYMTIDLFSSTVSASLGPAAFLGTIWAYVLPALMIGSGVLLALGLYVDIGVFAAVIALGSIPVGMFLKPVLGEMTLTQAMPPAVNAMIWLVVFAIMVKMSDCGCDVGKSIKG